MEVTYEFKWNEKTKKGLEEIPSTILYKIARQTLDMSYPIIPKDTKTMSRQTMANGVRGSSQDYYIRSSPEYASYVWKMTNVNWTTPGTNNQWFARALKQYGSTIINNSLQQAWKEEM